MKQGEANYREDLLIRSWPAWLAAYDTQYMLPLRLSPRTRVEYRRDLAEFASFLAQQRGVDRPDQLNLADLRAHTAILAERGLTVACRRRKIAAIRSFLHFLYQQHVLQQDLALRVLPPPRVAPPLRVLSAQECSRLRAACTDAPRDAALVGLMLNAGLRLDEVRNLRVADLMLPRSAPLTLLPAVRIRGVPHRSRTLPLDPATALALNACLDERPAAPSSPVFLSKFKRSLSIRGVRLCVAAVLARAGIADASVHTLRHTYAVNHLRSGASLHELQLLLGHASRKTTARYEGMLDLISAAG